MDELGCYLKQIMDKEGYKGRLSEEENKYVLLTYFNDYTFVNKEQAIKFFAAWEIIEIPLPFPSVNFGGCARSLGEQYNVYARMDGLRLLISPRKTEYSWNNKDGWHEGYDPFMGDINYCQGDTLEEAVKSLYVTDTQHIWPHIRTNKIGLITERCGYGKTHWVEHELINEINNVNFVWNDMKIRDVEKFHKKDILFITTRRSILDQQLQKGEVVDAYDEDFSAAGANEIFEDRDDKVRIITTSKLGKLYKDKRIEKMFPIVVIDELHSLFLDTMFAEESYFTIECLLNEFWDSTIKIGLTATPDLLFNYIDKDGDLFYPLDECILPHKYNADKVEYYNHTYLSQTLKLTNPTEESKVLVYCPSAKSAISFAESRPNSAFLISKYSRYEEAVEKQKPLYNYIIENEKLPDDVYLLFMTSAYREGVEIKDPSVKTIIIDASDEITISQFIGRIRSDIEKVIINTNKNQENRIRSNVEAWHKLKGKTTEYLAEQYGRQVAKAERNENVTLLVQKINDRYEVNKFFFPIHCYLLDCYTQANNEAGRSVIKVGNRPLLTKDMYFGSYLNGYSKVPVRNADIDAEMANWSAVDDYVGQRMFKEQKNELCEKISWRDNKDNSRLVKWPKVKAELIRKGYTITGKRSGSRTYDIISK